MNDEENILQTILDFCGRHRMKETTFGRKAMKNPNFVKNLRNGADIKNSTVKKLRTWMKSKDAKLKQGVPENV